MRSRPIPSAPFGYAGAVLVALGGLLPLVSLAVLGDAAAGDLAPGSGLLLAAVGVFAAGLLRAGRAGWAWMAGAAALGIALWVLGSINPVLAEAGLVLDGGRIGVRRAVVGLLTGEIACRPGLVALAAGALLQVVASGLEATRAREGGAVDVRNSMRDNGL